jgi:hypothetical protein
MKNTKTLSALFFLFAVSACGKIPSSHQGDFVDAATGTKLKLGSGSGVLAFADGRVLESKAQDLKFEALLRAQTGIYIEVPSSDSNSERNEADLFWIAPDLESRHEEAGLIWFDSEVLYSRISLKQKEKVKSIELFHCMKGSVILDTISKRFQIGCPVDPTQYRFKRIENGLAANSPTGSQPVRTTLALQLRLNDHHDCGQNQAHRLLWLPQTRSARVPAG